jgi:hypothetical protein
MCVFGTYDEDYLGVVVVGNFTIITGEATVSITFLNLITSELEPLAGLNGTGATLFCD